MRCLILCAGYATRLYPLTKDRPKPLLPVGGIPLLQRTVDKIREIPDVAGIHVVTNHRFAGHFQAWVSDYAAREASPVTIDVIDDGTVSAEDRLGAIGDMQYAITRAKIDDDLAVLSGDNLLLFDLGEFCRFGAKHGLATAIRDVKDPRQASLYGVIETDREGRITSFEEKPSRPKSSLVSIGAYYFSRDRLSMIDTYLELGLSSDQPGRYMEWLIHEAPVYGYVIRGQWYDIGDLESYKQANAMFGSSEYPG